MENIAPLDCVIQFFLTLHIKKDIYTTIFLGLAVAILLKKWLKRSRIPPGPIGLPLFGYFPFLGQKAYLTLHKLTLKYGPIFSFYLGRKLVIVVGSFKTAKEVLTNKHVMDRPKHPANHMLPNSRSFTISSGDTWKEQRQFSVQVLRQLGMGKRRMEEIIQDEIQYLLKNLSTLKNSVVKIDNLLTPSVSNNIYTLLAGHRLDFENEERKFLNELTNVITMYFRPTMIHAIYPATKYWFAKFKVWGYDRAHNIMSAFEKLVNKKIYDCRKGKEDENSYVHAYVENMKAVPSGTSFSDEMLRGNYLSIFGAGSTPSRVAIEWVIMTMARFPEIQKKIHDEINDVIGEKRFPEWEDQKRMPYTAAVIMEVLRSTTVVPVSMTRSVSSDTKICGYDIPKGSWVITNIWGIHHHPDYWKDPYVFNPDRFLRDGKVIKNPSLIPFSYGKRNCPGEDLANQLVFLYLTSILQRFVIVHPDGVNGKVKEYNGVARLLSPELCLLPRRV